MCRYPLLLTSALALVSLLPSSAKANQVDLSVSDVQVPTEILMGETFSINAILHCKGSEAATFRWAAYLTINGAIHGAVPLGEFGPVTITANSQLNINESISLPQTISGRQRIAIVVDIDNQVQERNEYDNTGLAVDYMRIRARQADLRVASVQLNVAESLAGESLLATYRVENIGTVAASFTLAGHISRNPAVTTGDTEVGRTTLELQPGQSSSQSLQLNLPSLLAAGDYYIAIIADPESPVSEIQEANNIGVAASSLNVYSPQLSIRTESLPQGTVFIDYYARVAALGGDGR